MKYFKLKNNNSKYERSPKIKNCWHIYDENNYWSISDGQFSWIDWNLLIILNF